MSDDAVSEVRVEPADLHMAGAHLADWHTDCNSLFEHAHSGIEDAVGSGWVGSSAQAMASKLDAMRTSATTVTDRLADHSSQLHSAGHRYTMTDDDSAHGLGSGLLNL